MSILSARDRHIEVGFLVVSTGLLLWSLGDLFGADTASASDYAMLPLLTSMVLASASQLARAQPMRGSMRLVAGALLVVALVVLVS
jgi:hypothetical protein